MTNVRKNSAKLTREDLKIAPESPTMELSETPAVEPSDQTRKTVRHAPARLPGGRDCPTVGDLQPCCVQSVQHHEILQGDPPRYQHPGKQAEL